jgi:hypothetical protein
MKKSAILPARVVTIVATRESVSDKNPTFSAITPRGLNELSHSATTTTESLIIVTKF